MCFTASRGRNKVKTAHFLDFSSGDTNRFLRSSALHSVPNVLPENHLSLYPSVSWFMWTCCSVIRSTSLSSLFQNHPQKNGKDGGEEGRKLNKLWKSLNQGSRSTFSSSIFIFIPRRAHSSVFASRTSCFPLRSAAATPWAAWVTRPARHRCSVENGAGHC